MTEIRRVHGLLPVIVILIGCSQGSKVHSVCESGQCGRREQALSSVLDLLSQNTNTCTLQNARLVNCSIMTQTVNFTAFETAVPLRTTVTSQISGTCPTRYPLQVSLSPDGQPATNFAYYRGGAVTVKRTDGGPVGNLTIADSSAWTSKAVFDQSCGFSLTFSPNEADVNSKADAQAIIDGLTQDLVTKQATADNYHALLLYSQAYQFLFAIANHFYDDWTGDAMEKLRADAKTAKPALALLITNCQNTPQQRLDLLHLYTALGTLGDPGAWTTDAGVKMTLSDVLGPEDQKVLATIQQLTTQQSGDGGAPPDYDALYLAAQQDAATAQHKLDLAKAQLANWLN